MTENNSFDLIIKAKQVYLSNPTDPKQLQLKACHIGVRDGKIAKVADDLSEATGPIWEAPEGCTLLPGMIDSQVHFRDPGASHKEDFETGTQGAVLGGITAVYDMPNTKPNTSTVERFTQKLEDVGKKAWCDFGLYAGATGDNSDQLEAMENINGCCGIKIFMGSSTGDLLVAEDEFLAQVLATGRRMVSVHCEDEHILEERKKIAIEKAHPSAHPEWRNVDSAFNATKRIVSLAKKAGRRIHTLHITTEEELEFLRQQKDIVTVEILPQHMYFSAPECYEKLGSFAQMNPPIRDKRHQQAIRKALQDGTVNVVASDHAPHTIEEKKKTYPQCPSGLTGVQTILPVMLNFVNEGLIDLPRLIEVMSINPARLFKAKGKGGIYEGQDADFTVVDMNKAETVKNDWIASRCGWTPYDGETLKGWPVATIIRGQFAMENGKLKNKAGRPITFE